MGDTSPMEKLLRAIQPAIRKENELVIQALNTLHTETVSKLDNMTNELNQLRELISETKAGSVSSSQRKTNSTKAEGKAPAAKPKPASKAKGKSAGKAKGAAATSPSSEKFPINKRNYAIKELKENEEFRKKFITDAIQKVIDEDETIKSKKTDAMKLNATAVVVYNYIKDNDNKAMEEIEKMYEESKKEHEEKGEETPLEKEENTPEKK